MTKSAPTTIQSVARASRALLAVAATPQGLTAREVAERFGLTTPTAHHLLRTLSDEGLVEKNPDTRRFLLGPLAAVIADGVAQSVEAPAVYTEALEEVARSTGEMAYLSGWRGGKLVLLRAIETAHAVRVTAPPVGFSAQLHARASGKLMLALARPEVRESFLRQMDLVALTEQTITTMPEFRAELAKIRAEQLSHDNEEFVDGAHGVSVPIWAGGVPVASLAVHVPVERYRGNEAYLIEALQRAAATVSHSGANLH